jgi:hypothetical protein
MTFCYPLPLPFPYAPMMCCALQYSYTGQSLENLIRSAELFDKLAVKFRGRALFCKDTVTR